MIKNYLMFASRIKILRAFYTKLKYQFKSWKEIPRMTVLMLFWVLTTSQKSLFDFTMNSRTTLFFIV